MATCVHEVLLRLHASQVPPPHTIESLIASWGNLGFLRCGFMNSPMSFVTPSQLFLRMPETRNLSSGLSVCKGLQRYKGLRGGSSHAEHAARLHDELVQWNPAIP